MSSGRKVPADRRPAWHSRRVTHSHVAGSIHADVAARAPGWLSTPTDVNALLPELWSEGVGKDGLTTVVLRRAQVRPALKLVHSA